MRAGLAPAEEGDSVDVISQNVLRRQARLDPLPFDPSTGEEIPRVMVRVDVQTLSLAEFGQVLEHGEQVISIYETDLPRLRALVEDATPAQLAVIADDLAWHRAQCEAGDNPRTYEPDYGGSFCHVMHRGPKPIASMEILEPSKPAKRKTGTEG